MRVARALYLVLFSVFSLPVLSAAQGGDAATVVSQFLNAQRTDFEEVALRIWDWAEVGYQEEQSSELLQEQLTAGGFSMDAGVAGMPTGFVAEWGSGGPVIGILAEFDALPGVSQAAVPEPLEREGVGAGHACGHHLFGTASVAAGLAIRDWLERSGTPGRIRVYGTPAEEGGAGKVYMVREGLFADVDAVLAWHPGDRNDASPGDSLANLSAKFRFRGVSAHAAGAPDQGRSALDAVEAMNFMVNLMREHVHERSRIHYVITRGGEAPNVVPNFAEAYYYNRHPSVETARDNWARILKIADAAALGTGTQVEHEMIHGIYNILPNEHLGRLLFENMKAIGGFAYTDEERAFAEEIQKHLQQPRPIGSQEEVMDWARTPAGGSTDVADVSWVVPTAQFRTATWVPGTPAHSWQAVACGGTSIGLKGMHLAAQVLARTGADLFEDPSHLDCGPGRAERRPGTGFQVRAAAGGPAAAARLPAVTAGNYASSASLERGQPYAAFVALRAPMPTGGRRSLAAAPSLRLRSVPRREPSGRLALAPAGTALL